MGKQPKKKTVDRQLALVPRDDSTRERNLLLLVRSLVDEWKGVRLEDLTPAEVVKLAKAAKWDEMKLKTAELLNSESEDVQKLVDDFIRTRIARATRISYSRGLKYWLAWCDSQHLHPLRVHPRDADLFASTAEGHAGEVNVAIVAASSWYSQLLKWEKVQRTPFINVKRRVLVTRPKQIPDAREVYDILEFILTFEKSPRGSWRGGGMPNVLLHAAVYAMAYRGFRVGALPGLTIEGDQFSTGSKGKAWRGKLLAAEEVLRPLGDQPFKKYSTEIIKANFKARTVAMMEKGLIRHAYSAHDLRHFFACAEYTKNKNAHKLSVLLNHSNIAVTDTYLQNLGVMEGGEA